MLDKHKNIIENYMMGKRKVSDSYTMVGSNNNYSFEVFNNELKIKLDDCASIRNTDNGNTNYWIIKDNNTQVSIIINKIDSMDVVALISIINEKNNADVIIKQTPTNIYISYQDKSIGYYINKVNSDTIINIIEDYLNKKRMFSNINKTDIFNFLKIDIVDIFITINNNKEKYIKNLNYQLNNLNANYVMNSEHIKKKLKTIDGYHSVIDK